MKTKKQMSKVLISRLKLCNSRGYSACQEDTSSACLEAEIEGSVLEFSKEAVLGIITGCF